MSPVCWRMMGGGEVSLCPMFGCCRHSPVTPSPPPWPHFTLTSYTLLKMTLTSYTNYTHQLHHSRHCDHTSYSPVTPSYTHQLHPPLTIITLDTRHTPVNINYTVTMWQNFTLTSYTLTTNPATSYTLKDQPPSHKLHLLLIYTPRFNLKPVLSKVLQSFNSSWMKG